MPLSKHKKKEILDKVTDIASKSTSVVFVNFHALPVAESTALRAALRAQNVGYTVAKKTLVRKAFGAKKVQGTMPELTGELAVAYGNDDIAPAREVHAFEKKFEGKISILGGIFGGAYVDKERMIEIASIPSRENLLGMFVNLINSPIARLAIVLNEVGKTKTA
jgi:large subunit ribosomal protein L10